MEWISKVGGGLVAGLVALWLGHQAIGNNIKTEEGVDNGIVTSFGRKGIIFKTYEIRFALGGPGRSVTGYCSLDGNADETETEGLAAKLTEATEFSKRVRVYSENYLAAWPWRGETRCFIKRVEYLDDAVEKKE